MIKMENIFKTLWESPKKNKEGKSYLKIKSWKGRYFFAERLGINSIAFILYNKKKKKFGLVREFKNPIDSFLITAFGGSLDNENKNKLDILIEEVKEEAGYKINKKRIYELGKIFVSTQMNQFCFLYLIDITGLKYSGKTTNDKIEKLSETIWLDYNKLFKLYDWKSLIIVQKAIFNNIIKINRE